MEPIELQISEQGSKNGAKRMRRPLQQIVLGTQQAQQAIDDGDEQRVINDDALSLSGAFTSLRGRQGQRNAAVVCFDLKTLQRERFPSCTKIHRNQWQ